MNKTQYLSELKQHLRKLPAVELEEVMNYYTEYFEEAGPEKEAEIIQHLGNPKDLAKQIISECAIKAIDTTKNAGKKSLDAIWIILLAICSAPIALPMVVALLAVLSALAITAFTIVFTFFLVGFALVLAGIFTIVVGFIIIFQHFFQALLLFGTGLICIGVGILLFYASLGLGSLMYNGILSICKHIFKK